MTNVERRLRANTIFKNYMTKVTSGTPIKFRRKFKGVSNLGLVINQTTLISHEPLNKIFGFFFNYLNFFTFISFALNFFVVGKKK